MLTSSWAIAHAPWRPVLIGIARRAARPQHTLAFSATVARHPAIVFEGSEERSIKPTRKNIFRNYATSSQSLQLLVEEAKYEEATVMLAELRSHGTQIQPHPVYARVVGDLLSQRVLGVKEREVLTHWLELIPDVRLSEPVVFRSLIDDLRHHIKAESVFAMSVGRILAQKGYKALVEDEILPLARTTLENDAFASLEQELSRSLAEFVARAASTAANHSEVFEDASEDYTSVMAASAPPPPSVLKLVEMTLPHTLPVPDPADQSVFEDDMDDDYAISQPVLHHPPRQFPTDQLLKLVEGARYDDAFHLLTELQHLHIPIPFSHTYGTVAIEALRRPLSEDYTLEVQLKLFTSWLSLIPLAHESQGANCLQDVQRTIMLASLINLPLVARFCAILVGKGYAGLVGRQELAVVMRFANPDAVKALIQELEGANSSYWETYQPEQAAAQSARFTSRVRSQSIRYLAYSGRVEEAMSLVPEPGSEIQLSTYTLDKLLRTIHDANNTSYAQHVQRIESLRDGAAGSDHQAKLRQMHSEAEDAAMAAQLSTSASVYTGTLPEALRYLNCVLRKGEDIPHPFIIAEFLERYLATGRTRAPTLLLNIAINSSHRSTSVFLFAEMLYYRRMGQHHLIIRTFVNHFYLSGVPREDVLKVYREVKELEHRYDSSSPYSTQDDHSLTRICNFTPSLLPRGKAWPMKIHCNLVWHALVALTPTHPELENLYTKLLNLAQGQDALHAFSPSTSVEPLLPPPSWHQPVDSAAFTPFMRRLMSKSGPNRGSRIIRDMFDLGIQPSVYHYTELGGYYARIGQVAAAIDLLNNLESSSGLMERLVKERKEGQRKNRGIVTVSHSSSIINQTQTVPEPDLVFYISLMRGFIISKSVAGFEQVHKCLLEIRKLLPKKRFPKDQETILNEVYADFRMLSRKKGYDWKRERRASFVNYMEVS